MSASSQLHPTQSWQDWLTLPRFGFLLGTMILAAFPQVLLGLHSFVYRDFGLFGYPLAHYYRESFWRGEIPLWNPYNNFGIPFLAQWGTMVLYPPSLIYLLLPLPWSLGLFCLLHLWFGGLGMYVLTQKWSGSRFAAGLAGIGFAFNGLITNCLMWPNYTSSLAWMPWVVVAVWQAWSRGGVHIVYAALVATMQMLSGTPEVILFTWLILAALWLEDMCRRRGNESNLSLFQHPDIRDSLPRLLQRSAARFGLIVVLVSALSAAQLLPFLDLLSQSQRSSAYAQDGWSIPVWSWANLLVPLFRTHRTGAGVHFQESQGITSSYYPGLALIILSILALVRCRDRRVWFLCGVLIVSFAMAMGPDGVIYTWVRKAFPAVGLMRYPVKFLIVCSFVWPILAAFGFAALLRQTQRWRGVVAMTTVATIVAVGAIVLFARFSPFPDEVWAVTCWNGLERVLWLVLIAVGLAYSLRSRRAQTLGLVATLVLVWLDFLRHVPVQNPTVSANVLTIKLPHLEQMRPRPKLGESRALLTLSAMQQFHRPGTSNLAETYLVHRSGLYDNCNLIDRVPKADGFYALYFRHERDIHFRLFEADDQPRAALGKFLGISQTSGRTNLLAWEPRTDFMPLITAGQQPRFANRTDTLARLIATNFSPEKVVYLPNGAQSSINVITSGTARVISLRVREHRLEAQVEATATAMVVVAQAYHPAWRAYVDGKPVELWVANHAFQALQVPSGLHRVELVYRDKRFILGLCIATMAAGGLMGYWLLSSRKRTDAALLRDTAQVVQSDGDSLRSGIPAAQG